MKAIYFDMDGTIADFYNVPDWLNSLQKGHTKPYRIARPLVNMRSLGRILRTLQVNGYTVGIISWASRGASPEFLEKINKAKTDWLQRHCGAITWDEIHIVEYGAEKWQAVRHSGGILFDDETGNREQWEAHGGTAYDAENILEILAQYL